MHFNFIFYISSRLKHEYEKSPRTTTRTQPSAAEDANARCRCLLFVQCLHSCYVNEFVCNDFWKLIRACEVILINICASEARNLCYFHTCTVFSVFKYDTWCNIVFSHLLMCYLSICIHWKHSGQYYGSFLHYCLLMCYFITFFMYMPESGDW